MKSCSSGGGPSGSRAAMPTGAGHGGALRRRESPQPPSATLSLRRRTPLKGAAPAPPRTQDAPRAGRGGARGRPARGSCGRAPGLLPASAPLQRALRALRAPVSAPRVRQPANAPSRSQPIAGLRQSACPSPGSRPRSGPAQPAPTSPATPPDPGPHLAAPGAPLPPPCSSAPSPLLKPFTRDAGARLAIVNIKRALKTEKKKKSLYKVGMK